MGATGHDAYSTRSWCKQHSFVQDTSWSRGNPAAGVGKAFFDTIRKWDAAIAATSTKKPWRYMVAKYVEIPAAGALLFAQIGEDLPLLGFKDGVNCIVFTQQNFVDKARYYLAHPDRYLEIRKAGRDLVKERHTIRTRMETLRKWIVEDLQKV
jgi:hypothetical protein